MIQYERGVGWQVIRLPAVALILLLCASAVFPQEAPLMLTPDEAVEIALKNNLSLQISQIDTATKKRNSDMSWNSLIPSVDLRGTLGRLNAEQTARSIDLSAMGGPVIPLSSGNQWILQGNMSVALNLNVALFEGMKNLKINYEAGLISYEKAKAQLERDVRKAYYQILLVQENTVLMYDNLDAAQRRLEMARANYRAGLVPELSVLQAEVAMENLKPTIRDLENAAKMLMSSFAMSLGLSYDTRFSLIPAAARDFIPLDRADLISKAALGRPDILELRKNIMLMESRRKAMAYQMYTPYLTLGWNADPTFQGDPMSDSWFMEDGWKQQSGMFNVTLSFNLNSLLPFTAQAMGLKEFDDSISTMHINLAQAVRGTEVEVYGTILQLEKSQTSLAALVMNVELADKAYRLTEQAYQAGLNELLDVQGAELERRKAQLEVLKENYNYLSGLIDLEYDIGVPFGTLSGERK